jgi:hypothetical protein
MTAVVAITTFMWEAILLSYTLPLLPFGPGCPPRLNSLPAVSFLARFWNV